MAVLHFLLSTNAIPNIYLVIILMLGFTSYAGIILSNLAISPLKEHIENLQGLSKETLHELNLPISTIKTNSQMIKKTLQDEKSIKRLERIENACTMLEQRYNELDYMIKTQTIEEIREEFDLAALVSERIEFISPLYPSFTFNIELEKTNISNDAVGLSKVIDNLIDNAVKYSATNSTIDITLHNGNLIIKDYGRGMDEVELLKVFDSYYQSDKNMQGFGIGLSLVKRFCDRQGIKLKLKSKPDVGTTITLEFKEYKE